jgi:hypothetical protein
MEIISTKVWFAPDRLGGRIIICKLLAARRFPRYHEEITLPSTSWFCGHRNPRSSPSQGLSSDRLISREHQQPNNPEAEY